MKKKLQEELKSAMRAKDQVRLSTIRALLTALQYEEIEKKVDSLPDEAALQVFQREVKKRKEELEFAEKAGRADLKDNLNKELAVIESFLPKQLSPAELEDIITQLKESIPGANMGVMMKTLKEKYAGKYDSKLASEITKKVLG